MYIYIYVYYNFRLMIKYYYEFKKNKYNIIDLIMEFEKTNLIIINKYDQNNVFMTLSCENSIKRDMTDVLSLFRVAYVLITFIISITFKTKRFIVLIGLKVISIFKKDLDYYQDKEYNFCDNFRNMYNKDIENQLILFNITLNDIYFDIFTHKNSDYMSINIQTNAINEIEIILEMLNTIKYYVDKYNYKNEDIIILDIGSNIGLYTTCFGFFNYTVLSFEPLTVNNYILKKNICRNNYFSNKITTIIFDSVIYTKELLCNYYKDLKNNKSLVLCDKNVEKNINKEYNKLDTVKANTFNDYIPFLGKKRIILLRIDLKIEGIGAIESGKELISKYHIPFIYIQFNISMFLINKANPQDFLNFFINNEYKISLNGFLSNNFINITELMCIDLSSISLYLIYTGK